MELGSDLPVTLVIKAPNQRIEDQTVDCMLGWTVKKLKEHLRTVYPNKPVFCITFRFHFKYIFRIQAYIFLNV